MLQVVKTGIAEGVKVGYESEAKVSYSCYDVHSLPLQQSVLSVF